MLGAGAQGAPLSIHDQLAWPGGKTTVKEATLPKEATGQHCLPAGALSKAEPAKLEADFEQTLAKVGHFPFQ